jgi:two-component system, cell cycle sensor histidine kinase and response regulator CckA
MSIWALSPASLLRKAGAFALLLALSALAAIAFFSERDWREVAESRRQGQLSLRIFSATQRILGWVRDAETGQRGYLLTGRPEYLQPYQQAVQLLPADLKELRAASAGQGIESQVLELQTLVAGKLAELKLSIETRDSQRAKMALAMVAAGSGQQLMDRIRTVANSILADEDRRLTRTRASVTFRTSEAHFVTLAGLSLLAVLVIGAFAANERSAKQRESLIAELAEANRRSGEVRELLRTTFYSIGDGVITTDATGAVQLMNSMAEKLTGCTEEQARGKPVEEVFQINVEESANANGGQSAMNSPRAAPVSPVRAALSSGTFHATSSPSSLKSQSGAEFLVDAGAAPIHDQNGGLRGAVLVLHDVTELRRGEERLRHAAKLESLGVLAGGIAHDFNNLLVGIVGTTSLLEDYFPPGAAGRELLDTLTNAGNRAAQLTNQMLAYSGRGRFVVRPVDLSKEVEEISALVTASIAKNVALNLSLERALPKVEADAAQLQQLIMNLIVNGAEAVGEAQGWVAVSTSVRVVSAGGPVNVLGDPVSPGAYVVLAVSDTGHGMDAETRARIFDPFFTTKFTGRGLGLAATLGIVKGHGGAIEVESAPGQGATFRVYFPVARMAEVS